MHLVMSDEKLLQLAADQLGCDGATLMQRYYGSASDARQEMEEFRRTGRLQDSFAGLLRSQLNLDETGAPIEPYLGDAEAAAA